MGGLDGGRMFCHSINDLSWNSLFKMGDSMVGFIMRAVYGTLVTPSLAVKWDEAEDGMCKLCSSERGTI